MFIIISGLGFIVLLFVLPETKGLPLEEVARVFGDDPNTIAVLGTGNVDASRELTDVESKRKSSEKDIGRHERRENTGTTRGEV